MPGGTGDLALTPNEWMKAQRSGEGYRLYVVVNRKTKPERYLIQDWASKLNLKEEVSVVHNMVAQMDRHKSAKNST